MDPIPFSDMEKIVLEYTDPSIFFEDEDPNFISQGALRNYVENIFCEYIKEAVICDLSRSEINENKKNYLMDEVANIDLTFFSNELLDFYAEKVKVDDSWFICEGE